MEIKDSLFYYSNLLEEPLKWYHSAINCQVDPDHQLWDLSKKVLQLFLGIIVYLPFTALSLIGKATEWVTLKVTEDRPALEKPSPEKVRDYASRFKALQDKAAELLRNQTSPSCPETLPLPTQETLEVIGLTDKNRYKETLPPGVTSVGSGIHFCFFYDQTPDVVYKVRDIYRRPWGYTEADANAYVAQANRARALCEAQGLYLLQVPQSRAIQLPNGTYAIMQEKMRGNMSWIFQRTLHQELIHSPDSKDYAKELYRQLALFIAQFKMTDVKHDNIPITEDGYVALFDLDSNRGPGGSSSGFLQGGNWEKEYGLLNDLPPAWQKEIFEEVKPHLSAEEIRRIEAKMEHKETRSKKIWEKVDAYYQFSERQGITVPEQKLTLKYEHLMALSPRDRHLARAIAKMANEQFEKRKDWPSLRAARRLAVGINIGDPLTQAVQEDFPHWVDLKPALHRVTDHLKNVGIIFSATIHEEGHTLKIYC